MLYKPTELPFSAKSTIVAAPGMLTSIAYEIESVKHLDSPYGNCLNEDEIPPSINVLGMSCLRCTASQSRPLHPSSLTHTNVLTSSVLLCPSMERHTPNSQSRAYQF